MKTNVSQYDFERAFNDHGRGEQFTYGGLKALYDWLVEFEDDTGEEMELDVIALCCDFMEYESLAAFNCDYDNNWSRGDISDHTILIPVNDEAFIIQQF